MSGASAPAAAAKPDRRGMGLMKRMNTLSKLLKDEKEEKEWAGERDRKRQGREEQGREERRREKRKEEISVECRTLQSLTCLYPQSLTPP